MNAQPKQTILVVDDEPRMVRFISEGAVLAEDGARLETRIDTICVHGASPAAVALAAAVRQGLDAAGIDVAPFAGVPL